MISESLSQILGRVADSVEPFNFCLRLDIQFPTPPDGSEHGLREPPCLPNETNDYLADEFNLHNSCLPEASPPSSERKAPL
jgi:hypothetical protein